MATQQSVERTYLSLTLLSTLAAAFIWGINTLFLLDAGLSNTQAFAANAFFALGQVLFEVPTGVVADVRGRRMSYLLGAVTLLISTVLYLWMWSIGGPFWGWALSSLIIGLGFTFFTGATEAWVVDALTFVGSKAPLESVFAKAQVVMGVGMFIGAVLGGVVAQATNLGVPYVIRAVLLGVTIVVAAVTMHDLGFSPEHGKSHADEVRTVLRHSIDSGLRNRPVRWLMLAAPFTMGVAFYAFYAMQPYLLELYGDSGAYWVAGMAAALFAGAQIAGGLSVPLAHRIFRYRTHALMVGIVVAVVSLALMAVASQLWMVVVLFLVWSATIAAATPIRQAYLNGLIPSHQRATVLSFDSLMGSTGGVAIQPALGKVADVWGYGASYAVAAGVQLVALPFTALAAREHADADIADEVTAG